MPVLVTEKLSKEYPLGKTKVIALDAVDFVVEQGEFVAIMGPSGSGKSTLLHLMGGLDKPSEGDITLAGKRLSLLKDKQTTLLRRRNVGFVFQFFNLLPTLTAEENIMLPLTIDGRNVKKSQARLEHLLELVGLTERRRHKPEQLSGGEQQRVALARALITEPTIMLADEPTGNLDTKTGTLIMDLLRRSCDEMGQTIVVVTHDPRAASFADRIVFLRDGKIVNQLVFTSDIPSGERLRLIIEQMESLEFLNLYEFSPFTFTPLVTCPSGAYNPQPVWHHTGGSRHPGNRDYQPGGTHFCFQGFCRNFRENEPHGRQQQRR